MKKILLNGVMGAIWYLFCVCIFLLFAFNTHAVVFNPNLAVYFGSLYTGHKQYNNKFFGNTVIGGALEFEKQGNLVNGENSLLGTTTTVVP